MIIKTLFDNETIERGYYVEAEKQDHRKLLLPLAVIFFHRGMSLTLCFCQIYLTLFVFKEFPNLLL